MLAAQPLIRHGWIDEISVRIQMTYPQLGKLAGSACDSILVALRTGCRIEERA
jgi:hypothetical protein